MTNKEKSFPASVPARFNAALVLADGNVFFGYGVGKEGITIGEVCFNTSMTGYQEILTDPSYTGQIITFTFPHVGNTGATIEDMESVTPTASGLIIRDDITNPSNFRSESHLNDWLIEKSFTGICGVDTRALTIHIRKNGAQNVAIVYFEDKSQIDLNAVAKQLADSPSMEGSDLAIKVACTESYKWKDEVWELEAKMTKREIVESSHNVVAVDFGVKHNILRCLKSSGCNVTVVPAKTSAEDILKMNPDGVFLSNGPGDPAATGVYAVPEIKKLVESGVPIFGICLGHQMLSIALGCETEKMHQGHRGGNHPVQRLYSSSPESSILGRSGANNPEIPLESQSDSGNDGEGRVEITSQNHGFVVKEEGLPSNVEVTHRSLFDGTIEGIRLKDKPVFSVQHHPEASPGPHDSHYLFDEFVNQMSESRVQSSAEKRDAS